MCFFKCADVQYAIRVVFLYESSLLFVQADHYDILLLNANAAQFVREADGEEDLDVI